MSDVSRGTTKAPQRPAGKILADIERERSELNRSFEALRSDLDAALGDARQRAREAGKKAAAVAPVAAGLVALVAVGGFLLRRRAGKGK